LAIAREKVRRQALANVELVLSRAEAKTTGRAPFDCIGSSYLAKYADCHAGRELINLAMSRAER
jgi:demethylmenaquinone methyltransferase / 2-methoxy-6-polyprenyl-1,4-benzoquinol methylase